MSGCDHSENDLMEHARLWGRCQLQFCCRVVLLVGFDAVWLLMPLVVESPAAAVDGATTGLWVAPATNDPSATSLSATPRLHMPSHDRHVLWIRAKPQRGSRLQTPSASFGNLFALLESPIPTRSTSKYSLESKDCLPRSRPASASPHSQKASYVPTDDFLQDSPRVHLSAPPVSLQVASRSRPLFRLTQESAPDTSSCLEVSLFNLCVCVIGLLSHLSDIQVPALPLHFLRNLVFLPPAPLPWRVRSPIPRPRCTPQLLPIRTSSHSILLPSRMCFTSRSTLLQPSHPSIPSNTTISSCHQTLYSNPLRRMPPDSIPILNIAHPPRPFHSARPHSRPKCSSSSQAQASLPLPLLASLQLPFPLPPILNIPRQTTPQSPRHIPSTKCLHLISLVRASS